MNKNLAKEHEIIEKVKKNIGKDVLKIEVSRPRRIFMLFQKNVLEKAVRYLTKRGFSHLSTITAVDLGNEIEVLYHLNRGGSIVFSLKVRVSKDKPILPTITNLVPGAMLYEREVHDLFGVSFEGHPDLSPLILPEGWPSGVYPLRKEWTIEKIQKRIRNGEKQ